MRLDELVYHLATNIPRHRKKVLFGLIGSLLAAYFYNKSCQSTAKEDQQSVMIPATEKNKKGSGTRRVGVNAAFYNQLKRLLPVCVPGIASKEFALLAGLAGVLILRTGLDIWFAAFNGRVVRSIVTRDWRLFVKNAVIVFAVMMWPMSVTNNAIKLIISRLSLCFRARLTKHAHQQYLRDLTFYKVVNLDNRVQNIDQVLSQDIVKFADSLAHLYSDITKPLVDIGLFAWKLGQSLGVEAPLLMLGYFASSGWILRTISPPFGRFTAKEQGLEGEFRYAHSRVIAHSEEIAFYRGAARERSLLDGIFDRIVSHAQRVQILKFANGIVDSVLVKYCATQLAYFLLSRPVFASSSTAAKEDTAQADFLQSTKIMEEYSRNSGYLINLSQAVGRLVLAGRDLTRFAGYTWRVAEMFSVLEDVSERHRFQRTVMGDAKGVSEVRIIDETELSGRIEEGDDIEFKNVNVITPTGDLLVRDLSLVLAAGHSCLITGPNGSGKSSLFRLLGGLWPLFGGGEVIKPPAKDLFYVPQRPYLPLGSLRDQLIYPLTEEEFFAQGHDDGELLQLLRTVHLEYLIDRAGALDAQRDWQDVLSGGEKQRVAMARLFLHRPRFAILDECTSAVSIDVEASLYEYAQNELGMTLFTISHRPSLDKFHTLRLAFDGQGGYTFGPCQARDSDHQAPNDSATKKEGDRVIPPRRRMSTTAMEAEDFFIGSYEEAPRPGTPQFIYSYPQRRS